MNIGNLVTGCEVSLRRFTSCSLNANLSLLLGHGMYMNSKASAMISAFSFLKEDKQGLFFTQSFL